MNKRQRKLTTISVCFLILAFIGAENKILYGQTNQEKSAQAKQMFAEGKNLANTGAAKSQQASIPKFDQARRLYHEIDNKKDEANCLNWIAYVHSSLGEKQLALKYYNESLALYIEIGSKGNIVTILGSISAVYSDLGDTQLSLKYFNQSLTIAREVGDKRIIADALNNIGKIYYKIGEEKQALQYFNESLLLQREVGDKRGIAALLHNTGRIHSDLGNNQQALQFLNESLLLIREVDNKSEIAMVLVILGDVYSNLGNNSESLQCFSESLLLAREVGDKRSIATALASIGKIYSALGENQQALKYFNESLLLRRDVGNKIGEAADLNNIGEIYSALGENQQALKYYGDSLLITRSLGNKKGIGSTLNNIGMVYSELGEKQQALKYFNESLPLKREVGDKLGIANLLNNIGGIYYGLGEKQQALQYLNESLLLYREVGNRSRIGNTLNNIGGIYSDLGNKQQALKLYNESLVLRRIVGDKRGEAVTLVNIGGIYFRFGEIQQASENFNEALLLTRAVGDKVREVIVLNHLFLLSALNPRFSTFYAKLAVNNYNILRSNVYGLDKNTQQTFLKSFEFIYRGLIDVLVFQKRYAEAQQVLNSFKDQQYFDFNQNKQLAPLAVTTREAELTITFNQKIEMVVAATRALDEYKRGIGTRSPTAEETAQIKSLTDKQTATNDDYLAFLKSADKEFAAPPDEKDKTPVVNDLTEMQTTLRELSAQTGEKSVAVYTLVGADEYRALVVTSDSIFSVSTPIKGAVLNEKAQQLWWFLHQSKYDPQPLAKEVYDVVFAPLAGKLPADTKTILWSLDGSLRYVPMAALHDGKQYLVERYNNVVFTRADKERLTRDVSANLTGTGFGSSRRQTVKLGGESFEFPPLVYVKPELERIFKNSSSTTGVVTGETMLDAQFTRATMISTLKKRRPLVHIASHFKFAPGDEANSFLLLGDGTAFTLDEMKQQKDLFAGVELLALSACDTAAQQADANGREVDGFAELAQRLGAGAVMASLWEVSDNSTAELMARFYKTYNSQKGANKASALRSAQMALLSGEYKTAGAANRQLIRDDRETADRIKIDSAKLKAFKIDKASPFAHPYYWSPFVLIGNWK